MEICCYASSLAVYFINSDLFPSLLLIKIKLLGSFLDRELMVGYLQEKYDPIILAYPIKIKRRCDNPLNLSWNFSQVINSFFEL